MKKLYIFIFIVNLSLCSFGEPTKIKMWVHEVDTPEGEFYKKIREKYQNQRHQCSCKNIPDMNIPFYKIRIKYSTHQITGSQKFTTKPIPAEVASPLPPLNFIQIEKL